MFRSVGWPLLWAPGFFCNLDILYGGLGIGKVQFLIKKKLIFFSVVIFFNFWSLKPWIRIGSGSVSVLVSSLNLWIRIRIRKKWIRIRNTALKSLRKESNPELDPDTDPDLSVRGTDPGIWIRAKKSRIPNTDQNTIKILYGMCDILMMNEIFHIKGAQVWDFSSLKF